MDFRSSRNGNNIKKGKQFMKEDLDKMKDAINNAMEEFKPTDEKHLTIMKLLDELNSKQEDIEAISVIFTDKKGNSSARWVANAVELSGMATYLWLLADKNFELDTD